MSAIRKLAVEATDNGLLAPEMAAGIQRVKSAKSIGVRAGNWLSLKQAQALLNAPDITTTKGLRDRAIIAVLLGCGLRRSEVAALTMSHIQQRDGRWCIVDLVSESTGACGPFRCRPGSKWRSTPGPAPPAWWTDTCSGPCNRGDQVKGDVLLEKVVWQMLRPYAKAAGVAGIAPHDCGGPRRSCAARLAANLSRSKCCWATRPCRRQSGTLGRSRISCTHRTMESS